MENIPNEDQKPRKNTTIPFLQPTKQDLLYVALDLLHIGQIIDTKKLIVEIWGELDPKTVNKFEQTKSRVLRMLPSKKFIFRTGEIIRIQ